LKQASGCSACGPTAALARAEVILRGKNRVLGPENREEISRFLRFGFTLLARASAAVESEMAFPGVPCLIPTG
jgi:hypothetical protein